MWKWVKALFGLEGNKGVVEQVSDTVEKWNPGPVKKHEMSIEQLQAEDASQASARSMQQATHDDIFNRIIDGISRLPRPIIAFWAIGQLFGILVPPTHLSTLNPIVLNIVWTVVGFYFGIRTISQDIPKLINAIRGR